MGKHTPRDQRFAMVAAWRESGDSMRAFAIRHRMKARTFRAWVSAERQAELRADFLEVQLPAVMAPTPRRTFAVRVAGLDFAFDEPPPPDWFAAVLRGVGRC